jgi:pseudo-rSAM protein
MGDVLDTSYSNGKPMQTVPLVTIHKSTQLLKKQGNRSVGEGMMEYLTELSLYINGDCRQNCEICTGAFKQFPCCTKAKMGKNQLELSKIQDLLKQLAACKLLNINILGGDILAYEKWAELVKTLDIYPVQKTVVAHYMNMTNSSEHLKMLNPEFSRLKIPVTFPIHQKKLQVVQKTIKNAGIPATFTFILQNEREYKLAEACITTQQIRDCDFKPFFNGHNLEFFQQNVFFQKEEILESKPSLRDIYQNTEVNSLNFGRLTIFSNGHIHANPNAPRLGILGTDSLYDVLYKEMYHGRSWRRIRRNVAPCKSCTLQAVCPPLSNYTHAVGQNDLCFKGITNGKSHEK